MGRVGIIVSWSTTFQIFIYEMLFNKKQEGFESHWISEDISQV